MDVKPPPDKGGEQGLAAILHTNVVTIGLWFYSKQTSFMESRNVILLIALPHIE
jgi:hypothetical protein